MRMMGKMLWPDFFKKLKEVPDKKSSWDGKIPSDSTAATEETDRHNDEINIYCMSYSDRNTRIKGFCELVTLIKCSIENINHRVISKTNLKQQNCCMFHLGYSIVLCNIFGCAINIHHKIEKNQISVFSLFSPFLKIRLEYIF